MTSCLLSCISSRSEKDILFNSFPTSRDFCRLLITFANSLDPDQARQNVGPDLDQTVRHNDGIQKRLF